MWELVSFMLALGLFTVIVHYFDEPKKIFEHINLIKGSEQRIKLLEGEVADLKEIVESLQKSR